MASNGAEKIPINNDTKGSETAIEIKIKTLDSQIYTLKVDKQMPVPALKEQIASVTGVLSERQRLICRGKVLKDDQLLSSYHVEDGHTLHMVVRQPDLPGSLPNQSATDPHSSTNNSHSNQIAPGVFIETFNVPVQGDGVPPEVNRIISAILGSIGISNFPSGGEGIDVRGHDTRGLGRTSGSSGISDSFHPQPEQAGLWNSSDRSRNIFGLPTAVSSLGSLQPPVIPDSLTTLSQYVSHLRHEFEAIAREGGNSTQAAEAHRNEASISSSPSGSTREGLLSPAYLAEVLHSTRRMFIEQANECLFQLATQLENQGNVTDPLLRANTQSRAWRTGVLFYNLGALLLELGRTTMALRLGQTPSEAVANGGPAVFISSSGPNHIMVQPLPFQPGASFGSAPVGAVQSPSGLGGGLGSSFYPRRIDIQIRRGTSTSSANANREEHSDTTQSASVERNPVEISVNQTSSRLQEDLSFGEESGVRIVPVRTMAAAVPSHLGRNPSESSDNSIGLYYPVIGRFEHAPSGHGNSESGSQPASQHHASDFHAVQQPTPASTGQRQSMDDPTRNGNTTMSSSSIPSLRQEPSCTRRVNIDILTAGGLQNNQESERQIPNNVLQFIRAPFPGGEIHVEDSSSQGTTGGTTLDLAGTSTGGARAPELEPRASEEGIFLSNILREVLPLISQVGSGTHGTLQGENASDHQTASDSSTQVGGARRQSDSDPSPPNPKRQKME